MPELTAKSYSCKFDCEMDLLSVGSAVKFGRIIQQTITYRGPTPTPHRGPKFEGLCVSLPRERKRFLKTTFGIGAVAVACRQKLSFLTPSVHRLRACGVVV